MGQRLGQGPPGRVYSSWPRLRSFGGMQLVCPLVWKFPESSLPYLAPWWQWLTECLLPLASPRVVGLKMVLGIPPEGVFQES